MPARRYNYLAGLPLVALAAEGKTALVRAVLRHSCTAELLNAHDNNGNTGGSGTGTSNAHLTWSLDAGCNIDTAGQWIFVTAERLQPAPASLFPMQPCTLLLRMAATRLWTYCWRQGPGRAATRRGSARWTLPRRQGTLAWWRCCSVPTAAAAAGTSAQLALCTAASPCLGATAATLAGS